MPSYRDLTLNTGEYIPQYAGVPLAELQKTGDVLATRHYSNLAQLSQLKLLAEQEKSKLLPGAKSYVDSHIDQIDQALAEMAEKGAENSTARVQAMANAYLGDQGRLLGLAGAEAVAKELADETELLKQGKTPVRRKGVRETMEQTSVYTTDDKGNKILNPLYVNPYQGTVQPYQEPVPQMEAIWNEINPDSIEGLLRATDKTKLSKLLPEAYVEGELDLPPFFESLTKAGISSTKINEKLNQAWSSYKLTPSYKQQKELFDKSEAQLRKEFLNQGLLRTFEQLKTDYMATPAAALRAAGKGEAATNRNVTTMPASVTTAVTSYNPNTGTNYKPDAGIPFGTGHILGTSMETNVVGPTGAQVGTGTTQVDSGLHPQYLKDAVTAAEVLNYNIGGYATPTTGPPDPNKPQENKPVTEEDKIAWARSPQGVQATKDYIAGIKQRVTHPYIREFEPDEINSVNRLFQNDFQHRRFLNPATGEIVEPFKKDGSENPDWVAMTGGDATKFNITGQYDPKNNFTDIPGADVNFVKGYAVNVPGEGEAPARTFIVSELPMNTSDEAQNENVIYRSTNMRPGQKVDLLPGISAQEIYKGQAADEELSPEEMALMPIRGTIYGKTKLYKSPKHFADKLKEAGVTLPFLKVK